MTKDKIYALVAGVVSAMITLASLSGGTFNALFLAFFGPLPLMLAGLGYGIGALSIAAVVGLGLITVIGGPYAAGVYVLFHALPAGITVKLALSRVKCNGAVRWIKAGEILAWLCVIGVVALLGFGLYGHWVQDTFSNAVKVYLDFRFQEIAPNQDAAARARFVSHLAAFFPGLLGGGWIVLVSVNAAAAQALLARGGKSIRPSPAYRDLILPGWFSWPLILAAVGALIGSGEIEYAGRQIVLLLSVAFFFLGLAVIHSLMRRVAFRGVLLALLYVVLVFSGWFSMVVTGIGMIEQWAGLRERFADPKNGQEV
ncbi:DUF2232 domain-containing protein [Varunaivibrio sulfuroxidans]|uniref:Putative membrane protein DUF2232 n=1 Tax=Varunaivibrio sulfuroxidans TaxID=1773489 RepID=A0A4V2UMZ5_9PROT|nr:DUF2232 domain-containing protein [Varunaivibrio sulfuroxidans]TCS60131.1 putative membrane protein DUF2232 [Varunaivibrio sulfuroxidans]WES30896.1 DUF2232 domain-containing protein [Varunaivibrio sulfuroxidans]